MAATRRERSWGCSFGIWIYSPPYGGCGTTEYPWGHSCLGSRNQQDGRVHWPNTGSSSSDRVQCLAWLLCTDLRPHMGEICPRVLSVRACRSPVQVFCQPGSLGLLNGTVGDSQACKSAMAHSVAAIAKYPMRAISSQFGCKWANDRSGDCGFRGSRYSFKTLSKNKPELGNICWCHTDPHTWPKQKTLSTGAPDLHPIRAWVSHFRKYEAFAARI